MMTYLAKILLHLFELNNPKKKKKDRRRKKKKKVNAQIDSFVITTAAYILHTKDSFFLCRVTKLIILYLLYTHDMLGRHLCTCVYPQTEYKLQT
jgi:hypothetical protein